MSGRHIPADKVIVFRKPHPSCAYVCVWCEDIRRPSSRLWALRPPAAPPPTPDPGPQLSRHPPLVRKLPTKTTDRERRHFSKIHERTSKKVR
ncbi:hypothetical protein MTP99_011912 [Tenebrio molitor]|nr:hypothetical protein MTP99_011912 [Tenebrio molitor]